MNKSASHVFSLFYPRERQMILGIIDVLTARVSNNVLLKQRTVTLSLYLFFFQNAINPFIADQKICLIAFYLFLFQNITKPMFALVSSEF